MVLSRTLVIRAVYIWKCPECHARLRVLAEIREEDVPEQSTITCPVCLRKKDVNGRTVRMFMDGEDNRILDILGFQGGDAEE
jgi:hypothetical protein